MSEKTNVLELEESDFTEFKSEMKASVDVEIFSEEEERAAGTVIIKPRTLTPEEKKQIHQILKDWTTDHLQIKGSVESDDEKVPDELRHLDIPNLRPTFFWHVLNAPVQYFKILAKVNRLFSKAPNLFKVRSYSQNYLAKWFLWFELNLPREQRLAFRDNLVSELVYAECATDFELFPFLGQIVSQKSKQARQTVLETALSVLAAFDFKADEALAKNTIYVMIEIVDQIGLRSSGNDKRWKEGTREEFKDMMGYMAQNYFPNFVYAGKKNTGYSLLETNNVIFKLISKLKLAGPGRLYRMILFIKSIALSQPGAERLMAQIADILQDLHRLTDKQLNKFTNIKRTQQEYSIVGKMIDILSKIPHEDWSAYLQNDAEKFILGMIWWDIFVPPSVWKEIKTALDAVSTEKRLEKWYLMGFLGAALLPDNYGGLKIAYEGATRICSENGIENLYPATLQQEFELPQFILDALYAMHLPEFAGNILKLAQIGFRTDERFIKYILTQDFPLFELSRLTRLLTKFSKNVGVYVDLCIHLGEFLNARLPLRVNQPLSFALVEEKIGLTMIIVAMADSFLFNDAARFFGVPDMEHSAMQQLLEEYIDRPRSLTELTFLLEEVLQHKMIDRFTVIQVALIMNEICRMKDLQIGPAKQRVIRARFTELTRLLPNAGEIDQFITQGLKDLMLITLTRHPIERLDAIIEATKSLQFPDFVLRFLIKIAPMIVMNFERDMELTRENLQWAVSIYNKNADEAAIMEELEDKMKGQIRNVGKRLGSIPSMIRELAKGLGAVEEDVNNLIKAIRLISIKFAELEMLAPEHKVGMSKITMQKGEVTESRTVKHIVNRFMKEGINNIITALFHYNSAMPLFLDETGILYYLNLVMPVDSISQEDITVALSDKPVLYEERGFVFVNEILPMSIEAVEGDPAKLKLIFDTIVEAVRKDVFASDLGVRYLQNCATSLRHLSTRYRLKTSVDRILEWKPAISVGGKLKEMVANERAATPETRLQEILDVLKKHKEFENALMSLQDPLSQECARITLAVGVPRTIHEKLVANLQKILSHLGSAHEMRNFMDVMDDSDPTFSEWAKHIKDRDEFVNWYRMLSQGRIIEKYAWMRETSWYKNIKKDYWQQTVKKSFMTKIFSMFAKFEEESEHDKVIEQHFKDWFDKHLHVLGNLLVSCILLGDNIIRPSQLFAKYLPLVLNYPLQIGGIEQSARWFFMQECQQVIATLTPRDRIFADTSEHFSLEERVANRIVPELNKKVVAAYLEASIQTVPSEYQNLVRDHITPRLEMLTDTPEKTADELRFEFITEYFDHLVLAHIVLASAGNPEEEKKIRQHLTQKTWLYGGKKSPRAIEQEIDVFNHEMLGKLKDLWQREGVLTKEQVAKIEQEMPEEYQESIDALQVLMMWTMDPMKVMLLSELDGQPTLMKAISKDGELLLLLDTHGADSRIMALVRKLGGQPDQLKQALQEF